MSPSGGVLQELQQKRAQRVAEVQLAAEVEAESLRQTGAAGRKKPPKISPTNRSPASPSNNRPMSPTDVNPKITGLLSVNFTYIFIHLQPSYTHVIRSDGTLISFLYISGLLEIMESRGVTVCLFILN